MEVWFDIALLLLMAAICGLAVYHPRFDDTLLQRVALGGMCLGCLFLAWHLVGADDVPGPISWCIWFAALFAVETGRKIQAKVRNGTFREVKDGA